MKPVIIAHALQTRVRVHWWVGLNVVVFFASSMADPVKLLRPKHAVVSLSTSLKKKQMSVRWTSLVTVHDWLMMSWLSWERCPPGRCGWQDYSCHKCPVMQQSHKHFFCSREPMNSSSPPHPSSFSKNPRHAIHPTPHLPPAFPHAHPCQHKTQSNTQGRGQLRLTADH